MPTFSSSLPIKSESKPSLAKPVFPRRCRFTELSISLWGSIVLTSRYNVDLRAISVPCGWRRNRTIFGGLAIREEGKDVVHLLESLFVWRLVMVDGVVSSAYDDNECNVAVHGVVLLTCCGGSWHPAGNLVSRQDNLPQFCTVCRKNSNRGQSSKLRRPFADLNLLSRGINNS
jgi:hypothetical protein